MAEFKSTDPRTFSEIIKLKDRFEIPNFQRAYSWRNKELQDFFNSIVENEKVRLLLTAILSDEKKHHTLLKMVLDILVRRETITEEDWWDLLWKNVPFHGAPGG